MLLVVLKLLLGLKASPAPLAHLGVEVPLVAIPLEFLDPITLEWLPG